MYNTYLRPIKRIPVRSKETILPGATLFVFLHPCFRCDRFLVRFLRQFWLREATQDVLFGQKRISLTLCFMSHISD